MVFKRILLISILALFFLNALAISPYEKINVIINNKMEKSNYPYRCDVEFESSYGRFEKPQYAFSLWPGQTWRNVVWPTVMNSNQFIAMDIHCLTASSDAYCDEFNLSLKSFSDVQFQYAHAYFTVGNPFPIEVTLTPTVAGSDLIVNVGPVS